MYQTGCQKFDGSFDTERVDVEIEVAGQMRVDEKRRENKTDYLLTSPLAYSSRWGYASGWDIRVDEDMRVDVREARVEWSPCLIHFDRGGKYSLIQA